jgi:VanZ family protein
MGFLKTKQIILPIVWLIIIAVISGYPGQHVPKVPVWQFDKFVHTAIYFILSVLLVNSYNSQLKLTAQRFIPLVFILFGIFYGGIMEILQHYIFINRSGNWHDFFANALGSVLGVILYPFVKKLLPIIR